jgi:carbamoyltransferase
MRVLGLSALTHDPAAVLLGERGIEAALEESKLVRERATAGIPRAAIQYCLDHTGASWSDIAGVAVASRPLRAWMRHALFRARRTPLAPISSGYYQTKAAGELGRELNNFRILELLKANPKSRLLQLDHHLCHAASAFYASPFDRALILTLDEQGDGRSGLVALGEGTRIRVRQSIPFPHSPAWVYSQVTELVGYQPHHEEHKTQWLSLAGDPVFADLFVEMFHRELSVPRLNARYFNRGVAGHLAFSDHFYRWIGIAPSPEARAGDPLRAQLAASVQKATERLVARWLELLRKRTGERFLCLAGGLFLNPLLVAALEENTGFERIFVQPAAGNEGTALGAAWLVWHRQWSKPRTEALTRLDWGPSYSNEEIKQVLDNCKAGYRWMNSDAERLDETLRLLQAGRIVGWFQGAAEFGPRALGNRSLLASPFASYVKENLNEYVKHRESFRPFALAVTEEDCARYFDCTPLGRFLVTLGRVRAEHLPLLEGFLLPGNRARVQIVPRDVNPLLWALLKRFGEKAPAPLLVNTSFNLFGEPLVVTPRDAVRSYFCSGTDALVIGNFVLSKS